MKTYKNRSEFMQIINDMDLFHGIEIGVRDGGLAGRFLKETNIGILWGVDIKSSRGIQELVRSYPERYKFKKGHSPQVSASFEDESFDFIHIDADHKYESVVADLKAWWPKLKVGGVFSGDDYAVMTNPSEGVYGIVQAVNEFVEEHSLELFVTGLSETQQTKEAQVDWAQRSGAEAEKQLSRKPFDKSLLPVPAWYLVK